MTGIITNSLYTPQKHSLLPNGIPLWSSRSHVPQPDPDGTGSSVQMVVKLHLASVIVAGIGDTVKGRGYSRCH